MIPRADNSLRRSVLNPQQGNNFSNDQSPNQNDDDAERREARRRTIIRNSLNDTSSIEDNETLKKCLEIYNGNKISRENAWTFSLIDTLSNLLERHHKSLNNFKIAGSSLEASSKVYALRVDSIHCDVVRLSAGLNAQKFLESQNGDNDDDSDGAATGGDNASNPMSSAAGQADEAARQKSKPKRQRKAVSTVTKNKDTLNARLDTVPFHDSIFSKLNSSIDSDNCSHRLMNNLLLTKDSELQLRTNFRIWDSKDLDDCDYSLPVQFNKDNNDDKYVPCDRIVDIAKNIEKLVFRPEYAGYVISDMPDEDEETQRLNDNENTSKAGGGETISNGSMRNEVLAFDMNAESEPIPMSNDQMPIMDFDNDDFDDLTVDERTAIGRCRAMQTMPVAIEDLRPIDSSSNLEYSYRPMDKISQFWAGPNHWKFRRTRTTLLSIAGENTGQIQNQNQRNRSKPATKRLKPLQFDVSKMQDDLFMKWDENYKQRKANIQKKWNPKKLLLPTDMKVDSNIFFKYEFAPGLSVEKISRSLHMTEGNFDDGSSSTNNYEMNNIGGDGICDGGDGEPDLDNTVPDNGTDAVNFSNEFDNMVDCDNGTENNTLLEIPSDFEGAPCLVEKIVVPFAKRAKVIDMKSLKQSCSKLIAEQMQKQKAKPEDVPILKGMYGEPIEEKYTDGVASFQDIYRALPAELSDSMAKALSPAVAFYSVLHLANEMNLALIQQDDLKDFKIRQIIAPAEPCKNSSSSSSSSTSSHAFLHKNRPK